MVVERLASSAAGIAWVMIFAIVLALPITLAVLKSEASANLNDKRQELAILESEAERLESEFEGKLDLREIERIAVNEYGMIKLNETGRFLWDFFLKDHTVDEAVAALLSEYDVEESIARADVERFAEILQTNGFVE